MNPRISIAAVLLVIGLIHSYPRIYWFFNLVIETPFKWLDKEAKE